MNPIDIIQYNKNNYKVPKACPHCNSIAYSQYIGHTRINCDSHVYEFVIFKKNCCNREFLCIYQQTIEENFQRNSEYELLYCIPEIIDTDRIPSCIPNIAPRFLDLYNQSISALNNNLNDLAIMGFRSSLELLIKEYAINFLNEAESDVAKQKLTEANRNYFTSINLADLSNYIRVIGNDIVHFERKYQPADPEDLRYCIRLILNKIELEYNIANPPKAIPLNGTPQP